MVRPAANASAEAILVQDPLIQAAILFGRGKFYAGVLIEPISSERLDSINEKDLAEYRNRIWYAFCDLVMKCSFYDYCMQAYR